MYERATTVKIEHTGLIAIRTATLSEAPQEDMSSNDAGDGRLTVLDHF
jgi:hypothetical protein